MITQELSPDPPRSFRQPERKAVALDGCVLDLTEPRAMASRERRKRLRGSASFVIEPRQVGKAPEKCESMATRDAAA
jgi:hypothetical protein